MMTAVKVISS